MTSRTLSTITRTVNSRRAKVVCPAVSLAYNLRQVASRARRSRRPAFVWMTEHPCLATILDTSRLVRVGRLAEVWPGPISAAVLTAPDTELFAEHRLVQAALASMVREPQRLRVTLMENTGCAPRSHSRAAPPLLLSLTSACPPLCPPSQLQLPRPLPFQRAA